MNWKNTLFITAALGLFSLAVYYPHQPVGFYSDDLHLLRHYSRSELLQTWHGNWDPDGIENRGYRPLTTLSLYVRNGFFGESALAHRLSMTTLWCLVSVCVVFLLNLFQVPVLIGAIACCIWLATPYNATHVAWLSDGIHIIQVAFVIPVGLFWVLAERTALRRTRCLLWMGGILLCAAALLTREDSVDMLTVIASLPALDAFLSGTGWPRVLKLLAKYAVTLIFITAGYILVRHWALRGVMNEYTLHLDQFLIGLLKQSTGFFAFGRWSRILGLVFWPALFFLLWAHRSTKSFWVTFYLIMALVVSSAHALVITRVNLMIFPSLVFSVIIALGLWQAFEWNRSLFFLCAACFAVAFVLALRENYSRQKMFLPYSLATLNFDIENLYGEPIRSGKATIPPERRQSILEKLHSLGLDNTPNLRQEFNNVAARCQTEGLDQVGKILCVPGIRLPDDFKLNPKPVN